MSVSVTMPQLGESVTEGTVTRWLKAEGEQVEADEPLLEVSTDKVDTEIPSPASGTLASITVGEDETVEVGAELATIDDGSGGGGSDSAADDSAADEPAEDDADDSAAEDKTAADEPVEDEPADQADEAADQAEQDTAEQDTAAEDKAADGDAAEDQAAEAEPTTAVSDEKSSSKDDARPADSGGGDDATNDNATSDDGGAYVTPLVRKLATEHDVDLAALTGTGVGGRIRKQDVLDAARSQQESAPAEPEAKPAPAAAPTPAKPSAESAKLRGRTEKLTRLRKVIATRMVESLQTSAQLTTVVEADVTAIARLRQRAKADFAEREGVKLSFLPFFALATVEALKAHPGVNASIDVDAGTVTYHDAENLGMAVDTDRGLLVPVIKDAGDLNIGGLARKIADLADRTRTNTITPDELGGGTFTLTNTGSRGALFDTPIINQPQVGILGTGTVVKRAVVVDDDDLGEVIAVRSMVYLALTYDHRIVDGADATRFLGTVKERLEGGDFEAQLGL